MYCSELWDDDCPERVEITSDHRYVVTDRYGATRIGKSVTAGTGIPYRGLIDDNGKVIGRYRIVDKYDILILDMVIYHRQK